MKITPPADLLLAIQRDDLSEVEAALGAGATTDGWAAVLVAVAHGTSDAVLARLLQHGADPNEPDARGGAPLHRAVSRASNGPGRASTVQLLLEAGGDPLARDEHRRTPLHWAAGSGRAEVFELVLEAAHRIAPEGIPADVLDQAARSEHALAKVEALLRRGAAPEGEHALNRACGSAWPEAALRLVEAGAPVGKLDEFGACPLHHAAAQGHEALVRVLLERVASRDIETRRAVPDSEIRRGDSPADVAERRARHLHVLVTEALVRARLGGSHNLGALPSRHQATARGALEAARAFCTRKGSTSQPTLESLHTESDSRLLAQLEGAERIAALLGASLEPRPLQMPGAWKLVDVMDGPRRGTLTLAENGTFTAKLWSIKLRGTWELSEHGIRLSSEDGPLDVSFDGLQLFVTHPIGSDVPVFVFEPPVPR